MLLCLRKFFKQNEFTNVNEASFHNKAKLIWKQFEIAAVITYSLVKAQQRYLIIRSTKHIHSELMRCFREAIVMWVQKAENVNNVSRDKCNWEAVCKKMDALLCVWSSTWLFFSCHVFPGKKFLIKILFKKNKKTYQKASYMYIMKNSVMGVVKKLREFLGGSEDNVEIIKPFWTVFGENGLIFTVMND